MTASDTARRLRRDMTEAEKVIWRGIRSRQIAGYKFRRQEAIGRYIVDFVCFSPRLVVGIDGGQHADVTRYEEARTQFLEREGFYVLRFWNSEVLENAEGVGELSPHPPAAARRAPPSPTRGGVR